MQDAVQSMPVIFHQRPCSSNGSRCSTRQPLLDCISRTGRIDGASSTTCVPYSTLMKVAHDFRACSV